ncbi:MAG: multidrug DMT transporter permease [Lentisphaerota bacterium]
MFILSSYGLAVVFTVITMMCWGSWANTQKLAAKTWRFELFYWDYVIGVLALALIFAFTLGSTGTEGRGFLADILQADKANIGSALLGGVVFNAANILLVAAIALAGMAVAFPVGIGIALIMGVIINYIGAPQGNAMLLFTGVGFIAVAIIIDAIACGKLGGAKKASLKGIVISIVAGVLMASFYRFVAASMSNDFVNPAAGKMTGYSACVVFAVGIFLSNFIFNTIFMKTPVEGEAVTYRQYFSGDFKTHIMGILGGIIWCVGMSFSIIAAGKAGYAISYGLGQGATLVAALWGVFIWKEFKGASRQINLLLLFMFICFVVGIGLIIAAGK